MQKLIRKLPKRFANCELRMANLNPVDDIDNSNMISESSILLSFDIVNMFLGIGNILGLEAVSEILNNRGSDFPSAECLLEALIICVK